MHHFEPEGLVFDSPALLTLPYESSGGNDELIDIYYYNKSTNRWEVQPKVSQDTEAKTITVEMSHFSDYVAGMSAFKVDEGGTLDGGNHLGPSVDPYFGAFLIESDEFSIPARGVNLSLSARFNSDYFYQNYLSTITDGVAGAGRTLVPKANQVYTFPQTTIKSGWFYELPYCTFGSMSLVLVLGNGAKYDLSACVSAWTLMSPGASQTYGSYYKVYKPDASHINILIPEAKIGVKAEFTTGNVIINATVYFEDGSHAVFPASGTIKYLYDASGKNCLTYTFEDKTLKSVTHTDGRTVKILQYKHAEEIDGQPVEYDSFVYLLSTSSEMGVLNGGDQFLARRIFDSQKRLLYSDVLDTLNFEPVGSDFSLTAENESEYFRVLQRTEYTYNTDATVTNNSIAITEPGGGYSKYTFGISFGPQMVSYYYYYYSTWYGIFKIYTHVFNVLYQNKPKVISESAKVDQNSESFRRVDYSYNGNFKNIFTAGDYHYNYNEGRDPTAGYPTPHNTRSASTQKTVYKVTPEETDCLSGETIIYSHESSNPYEYIGVSQDETLKYDGTISGISTSYEKTTRTFSKIYGNYYPLKETVYRGGSTAWTVDYTHDGYGRVRTREDSRSGKSCMFYLFEGLAGDAGFESPYAEGDTMDQDLYTAFGALRGVAKETSSGIYQYEYYAYANWQPGLNIIETRRIEYISMFEPWGTNVISGESFDYDPDTNVLRSITLSLGEVITLTYGSGWKSSYVTQDSRVLSTSPTQYLKTDFDYDIRGRLVSRMPYVADSLGDPIVDGRYHNFHREYTYDGLNRVLKVTRRNEDDSVHQLLRKDYDDENRTVLTTDAMGNQALTRYDAFFRPVDTYTYCPDTGDRTTDRIGRRGPTRRLRMIRR